MQVALILNMGRNSTTENGHLKSAFEVFPNDAILKRLFSVVESLLILGINARLN